MKRSIMIFSLLAGSALFSACSANAASSGANNLSIGDYYQGGVIYWLDEAQAYKHGLIADIKDTSSANTTSYAWDTTPPTQTKATGNKVYTGKTNTQAIITAIGATRALASNACASSTNQGYSDWYLPAKKELALMFDKSQTITKTAQAHNGKAFDNSPYWSSTEYYRNSAWNLSHILSGGSHATTYKKNIALSVRCVRAF